MNRPKIPPVLHHSESIWCPHCGEEFGIESKVEYERQYGIDYCYKEMLRQFISLLTDALEDEAYHNHRIGRVWEIIETLQLEEA